MSRRHVYAVMKLQTWLEHLMTYESNLGTRWLAVRVLARLRRVSASATRKAKRKE